jgi:hypothetical protein
VSPLTQKITVTLNNDETHSMRPTLAGMIGSPMITQGKGLYNKGVKANSGFIN